jgi:bla regulator protein blaR1
MTGIVNHVWQSTAFTAMIALAAWALRRNSPRARYWLWLAASLKFLIPFSWLMSTGTHVQLPPDTPSLRAVTVNRISSTFAPVPALPAAVPAKTTPDWTPALGAIWLAGGLFFATRRYRQWRTLRRLARGAKRLPCDYGIPVFSSDARIEPGVYGTVHPVLLIPEGLNNALTAAQFETILVHELRHVHYRDNLTAALHMCVETVFWFYPPVWWIGAKLIDERERDCDEAVLAEGSSPGEYARGILRVCERYTEWPLPHAAGIGGADLKKRVREIMTWSGSLPITTRGKAALAIAATIALFVPFVIGIMRGQSLPPAPAYSYAAVSIHLSKPDPKGLNWRQGPQGGLRITHASAAEMILLAYQIPEYRLSGAPGWAKSEQYEVTWTPAEPEIAETETVNAAEVARRGRQWQRLQAILRDRFGLVMRLETHELPIYSLVRLDDRVTPVRTDGLRSSLLRSRKDGVGRVIASAQPIGRLAPLLEDELGRPVMDETGLQGQYDFKLEWDLTDSTTASDPGAASNPVTGVSLTTALKEQLGLRLMAKKGPVQVYVVERIERPSEN